MVPVIIIPQENWAQSVTPYFITGAAAAGYTVGQISDGSPGSPLLLTGNILQVRWDLPTPRRIDMATLHHHNIDPGNVGVFLIGSSTAGYTGDVFSQAFVIPAKDTDNFSTDSRLDLATLVPIAANRTAQYISFTIGTANSVNLSIGEIAFGIGRTLPHEFERFVRESIEYLSKKHKTGGGSTLTYSRGTKLRKFSGEMIVHDAEFQAFKDIWDYLHGDSKPFVFVQNPSKNVSLFGFATSPVLELPKVGPITRRVSLSFEEQGRGLAP